MELGRRCLELEICEDKDVAKELRYAEERADDLEGDVSSLERDLEVSEEKLEAANEEIEELKERIAELKAK